jgi:antitoxin ParD1/3/4
MEKNASEEDRPDLRRLEDDEAAAVRLRSRLSEGLTQANAGELAEGTGAEAIRRAFAKARQL